MREYFTLHRNVFPSYLTIESGRIKYITDSPTLYSQITGKYASVESKIFPHILLLCSISYSCFNGLTVSCPVYPAFDVGDRPHWT